MGEISDLNKACGMGGSPAIYAGKSPLKNGFTLVELSIVLVIIGLIIGGVLVGRDLIAAAEMQAQVAQIGQYQTALNTFLLKYNSVPGDMYKSTASAYGFASRGGGFGDGNGDGSLQGCNNQNAGNTNGAGSIYGGYGCETALFWTDLNQAGLIDFSVNFTDTGSLITVPAASLPSYLPPAKIGNGNYLTLYSYNMTNYFVLSNILDIGTGSTTYTSQPGMYDSFVNSSVSMTPSQAYSIDAKIDDGLPLTGRIVAMRGFAGGGYCWVFEGSNASTMCGGSYGTSSCLKTSTNPYTYNTSNKTPQCNSLMIRFDQKM